jgi:hypothetical protein
MSTDAVVQHTSSSPTELEVLGIVSPFSPTQSRSSISLSHVPSSCHVTAFMHSWALDAKPVSRVSRIGYQFEP